MIRRLCLDLLGLSPTPEDVEEFVNDESLDAWPRLIDRLLGSPRYGQRWGRHWLDVARYADDQLLAEYFYRRLPYAWRYRDWVVRALNDDMPYDQFVRQQIAGDLLVDSFGPESTVATGFLALGMIYQDDGGTPESIAVAKSETLDDRVDTVTRGLLGLTVSCARCHDHKFDPIPTEDYYSLADVFQNAKYVEDAPLVAKDAVERYRVAQQEIAQTNYSPKRRRSRTQRELRLCARSSRSKNVQLRRSIRDPTPWPKAVAKTCVSLSVVTCSSPEKLPHAVFCESSQETSRRSFIKATWTRLITSRCWPSTRANDQMP